MIQNISNVERVNVFLIKNVVLNIASVARHGKNVPENFSARPFHEKISTKCSIHHFAKKCRRQWWIGRILSEAKWIFVDTYIQDAKNSQAGWHFLGETVIRLLSSSLKPDKYKCDKLAVAASGEDLWKTIRTYF